MENAKSITNLSSPERVAGAGFEIKENSIK